MKIVERALSGVLLLEPRVFEDERGFFMETYEAQKYAALGIDCAFVQDNYSGSRGGTLRGLHYQLHHAQGKLVRVAAGAVFDVAVDLRRSASTFGQWYGAELSQANRRQIWIPPGFAHGFYVLSTWAETAYKVSDVYAPAWERTLRWDDPQVGIEWPLREREAPLLSEKDAAGKRLEDADVYDAERFAT